jgi:hypothetical protein
VKKRRWFILLRFSLVLRWLFSSSLFSVTVYVCVVMVLVCDVCVVEIVGSFCDEGLE